MAGSRAHVEAFLSKACKERTGHDYYGLTAPETQSAFQPQSGNGISTTKQIINSRPKINIIQAKLEYTENLLCSRDCFTELRNKIKLQAAKYKKKKKNYNNTRATQEATPSRSNNSNVTQSIRSQ